MPFHWSSKNNRSQHNLVGTTADDDSASSATGASGSVSATGTSAGAGAGGSGAANPPVALSNPAFSSSESFQQQHQQQQQPPPPPPHLYNNPGASGAHPPNISSLQHSNTVSGSLESRQPPRPDLDFVDSVSRSQSQRYPQGSQISPVTAQYSYSQQSSDQQQQQQQQQFLQQQQRDRLGLGSLEDLSDPGAQGQGQAPQPQQQAYFLQQQQQQQQQQQAPPPKGKQSVGRKLIKNILGGSSSSRNVQDGQHHHSHHSFSSHTGLGRRSSKRVSESPAPPPAIRTGVSQLSLEQTIDWQNQSQHQQPSTQHSPLQNSAEFSHESFADQQHSNPNPTIRSIPPSDTETSPYSPDDVGFHHRQAQLQLQGQIPSDHQQYSQAAFDSSPLQQQQQQHVAPHQQQYQFAGQQQQQQQQYQGGNQQHYSRHLGSPSQHENPETVSQFSHESPVTDSDQRSATNVQPPPPPSVAVQYADEARDLPARPNPASGAQDPAPPPQSQSMAPPAGGPPPPRRSQDAEKGLRGDQVQPPPGPPPSYRQSQVPPNMNNPLPAAPNSAGGSQNPNYRAGSAQDRAAFDAQGDIQGRNSPQPPSSDRGEDPEKAFKDLRTTMTKYKNVKRLYFDGKKEIELLNGQVEQLQNAIANQRMSQSRTSLDDSEYTTRFNRLNGAINNLAFNIRKHWVSLPAWLEPYVSADAIKTGKQEMTAVGRAVITRWLVDEIFHRCFHPGLDIELSRQLKAIEQNIRHFSYTRSSQEELEALTSKVVGWRMATLEGLQDVLRSNESAVHKAEFTQAATTSLINTLLQHVKGADGVDGSAGMIVELAVGIAANMPMESRDVAIVYPLPESQIDPNIMDVEKTGLPVLEARASDASEVGAAEENGKDGKDAKGRADKARAAAPQAAPKDSNKVRFAGFVAVEVRGRQVLVKSTVWAM